MDEPSDETPNAAVAPDHRAQTRRPLDVPVRVTFDAEALEGLSENLSSNGVLCFTERPLRVRVEFDHGDHTETRSGRVVRINRVGSDRTGLAIEFDASDRRPA